MAPYSFLFLAFAVVFIITPGAKAQDTLYLTNGTVVLTKGIHVKGDSLYYTFANDTTQPFATPVSEAAFLYPLLGAKVAYAAAYEEMTLQPKERMKIARKLARSDYKNTGVMWLGLAGATLYGLPAPIIAGFVKPKTEKFYTGEPAKIAEPVFSKAYSKGLYTKKIGKIAGGFGIGVGVFFISFLTVVLALAISFSNH